MSLSLMSQNMCSYSGCNLSFANLYDLIAHIEFVHIPLIEEEQRQKCSQAVESDNRTAPNLPLSYVCRVFRTPYRTTPSKPEAFRLNWCHYRKRPPPQASILPPQQVPIQSATTVSGLLQANTANIMSNANPRNPQNYIEMRDSRGMVAQNHQLPPQPAPVQLQQQPLPIPQSQSQHSLSHPHPHHSYHAPVSVSIPSVSSAPHLNLDIPNEVPVNNNPPEDLDECSTNDPEMRFKCTIIDCHLRYKNIHGLRNHLRVAHRIVFEDKNDVNQGYGDDLHGQLPSSPSKPHKCQYCSKRYKTPAGLTNHVNQAHQKTSGGYAGQNPEQAPSSPTVLAQLITQAQAERQHRTAMEQQQRNQAPPHSMMTHQRPLPVALAPNQHQVGQGQGQSQFQQPVHNQSHQHQYIQQTPNPQPPLPVRSIGNYSQQPQGPMQRSTAYSGAIPSSTGMQMQQPHSMHPPPQRRSHISHTQMAQQILQQGQLQQQMAQNQQQQGIPMQEMHPPHSHSQQAMMQRPEFYHNRPPPPNHQQQQQQQQQTQHEVINPNQPHYNQEMAEIAMDSSDAPGEENSDVLCFTPLGSGQEVGRSAHLLQFKGKKILLDCGVHPGMHGVDALPFVDFVDIENIDLLLITHFHLDHCGALPWLLQKTGFRGRCFMTHATKAIYRMLLGDYIRISRFGSAASDRTQLYTEDDLDKSMEKIEVIDFHEQKEVNGVRFWPYVAGHVLGACMFMIEIAGVKILYTGDFSCLEDRHLCAAEIPNIQPDILISESTYGTQIHEPREEREKRFTQTVHDIVGRGGRCLIPAFALGRAQELLLILDEYWEAHPELHDIPVYYASSLAKRCMAVYQTFVSGMNERIQKQIAVNNPFVFKHISNLKGMAHFEDVGPCVVLASPGMLQNGLSRELFEQWCTDSKNGCIIAGYCVEGTLAKVKSFYFILFHHFSSLFSAHSL
ncbi:hypothetical protein WR25_05920 [Diploscapter pachys]|uniref:C2H2-type domain-containing protein n=1 Tax=Diploscapter pachys TaxID=2018661 RepID=A0A2A2KVB2_9BILA|nr:hypothetical protein WR25_05920 [Diploscapter pachys]